MEKRLMPRRQRWRVSTFLLLLRVILVVLGVLAGLCVDVAGSLNEIKVEGVQQRQTQQQQLRARLVQRLEEYLTPLLGGCVEQQVGGWWKYRWCHKRVVQQFHSEVGYITSTQPEDVVWSAGRFDQSDVGTLVYPGDEPTPKKQSSHMVNLATATVLSLPQDTSLASPPLYLSYQFRDGQACDETGRRRKSEVRLHCCSSSRRHWRGKNKKFSTPQLGFVSSVSEVSTCAYLLTVCSPVVCLAEEIATDLLAENAADKAADFEDFHVDDADSAESATVQVCPNLQTVEADFAQPHNRNMRKVEKIQAAAGQQALNAEEDNKWTIRRDSNEDSELRAAESSGEAVNDLLFVSEKEKLKIKESVKDMFYHGWDSYMMNAFPRDEVRPLTCSGEDFELTAGNMLTMIDSLDMLAVLGNYSEFARSVKMVTARANFDLDKTVSVFETTIRILGGLISAHVLALDATLGIMPDYDGSLLPLIVDLADRLMPAFNTSTSIPYGTINLRSGVPPKETTEACTSAAGSLSLEFGMVSVLTGEASYGNAARSALRAIYDHRSELGLVGRHIDVESGQWTEPSAGIGSNTDSLYEYYIKQYMLFGDDDALDMFMDLYKAAIKHLRVEKTWYVDVNMFKGHVQRRLFNNLMSFWPGMQTLLGDLEAAAKTLNAFMLVWNEFGFTPEDFSIEKWMPLQGGTRRAYPLRPELIESVYYMSAATQNPTWLVAARDILWSVDETCRVKCGFASIKDIKIERLHDNMPSFFLAEFLKYLYLVFDEENFLREDNGGNYVFTTEAHPFPVRADYQAAARKMGFAYPSKRENMPWPEDSAKDLKALWGCPSVQREMGEERQCAALMLDTWDEDEAYIETYYGADSDLRTPRRSGFMHKTRSALVLEKVAKVEADSKGSGENQATDHVALVDLVEVAADIFNTAMHSFKKLISEEQPAKHKAAKCNSLSYTVASASNKIKVCITNGPKHGVVLTNMMNGDDEVAVNSLGGEMVAILQTKRGHYAHLFTDHNKPQDSFACVLSFNQSVENSDDDCDDDKNENDICMASTLNKERLIEMHCSVSQFGPQPFDSARGLRNVQLALPENDLGCSAADFSREMVKGKVVVLERGKCLFEEKALFAEDAGAIGVIIVQNNPLEPLFYMTGTKEVELSLSKVRKPINGRTASIAAYMVSHDHGTILRRRLRANGKNQNFETDIRVGSDAGGLFPRASWEPSNMIRMVASEAWSADLRVQETSKGAQWTIEVYETGSPLPDVN